MLKLTSTPAGEVRVEAPAKVNLYLEVLSQRLDGFHEILTVIQAVDFLDTIILEGGKNAPENGENGFSLVVEGEEGERVPAGEENLALRAARLLGEKYGPGRPAAIRLVKRIPPGTGLGGGSADAAGVLAGLNRWWGLDLDAETLARVGAELGSDVPFFFFGPRALCRGRGEQVEALPPATAPLTFLLVIPRLAVATGPVYQALEAYGQAAKAMTQASSWAGAAALGRRFNRLQAAAERLHPELKAVGRKASRLAGAPFTLTGSGGAYFAVFAGEKGAADARAAAGKLAGKGDWAVRLAAALH